MNTFDLLLRQSMQKRREAGDRDPPPVPVSIVKTDRFGKPYLDYQVVTAGTVRRSNSPLDELVLAALEKEGKMTAYELAAALHTRVSTVKMCLCRLRPCGLVRIARYDWTLRSGRKSTGRRAVWSR